MSLIESAHLSLSACQGNVDETTGVLETLEGAALGGLGLLLGLNLQSFRGQSSQRLDRECSVGGVENRTLGV